MVDYPGHVLPAVNTQLTGKEGAVKAAAGLQAHIADSVVNTSAAVGLARVVGTAEVNVKDSATDNAPRIRHTTKSQL